MVMASLRPTLDIEKANSLYDAAKIGNLSKVKELVSEGAAVDHQNELEYGRTPLCKASHKGHIDIVKFLFHHKADPNISDQFGQTPLFAASNQCHIDIVKCLCEHNADLNISDEDGMTPLCVAGSVAVAEYLVSVGADIHSLTKEGNTVLHSACKYNNTDLVKYFIQKLGQIEPTNMYGETPIHLAWYEDIIECLIAAGADISVLTSDKNTVLHSACKYGNSKVLLYLIREKGFSLKTLNKSYQSPIDLAKDLRHSWCLQQLEIEGYYKVSKVLPSAIDKIDKEIKEVSGRMKISRVLLHGAPRVGKTSVKRLVLNQPAKRQDSTRFIEDPVRAISTCKTISVDQTSLEELDEEKVITMIRNEVHRATRKRKSMPSTTTVKNPATRPQSTKPTSSNQTTNRTSLQCTTTKSKPLEFLSKIAADLDSVKPNAPSLLDCHHVHLVDSGGQPQFSNLLPLVLQSQSHHMVVIRLDKMLHDKADNCVKTGGTKHVLSEHLSLTNYQLIERVCQLASGTNSRVIVIGTHLDCENTDEPLSKKIELLKPLMTKYENNLVLNENGEPILAVNAMTENAEERRKFAEALQEVILGTPILVDESDSTCNTEGIPVPLRWMILEIEMSRRSKQVGVLEMKEIEKVADSLEITNLPKALEFFKKLALHYYYPEVLPNKVFTSISPISSLLSNIVEASFQHPKLGPVNADQKRLQTTGELTTQFLKQLSHRLPANELFPMEEFIRLMRYLRILFDVDNETYLIPSLLPVETTAINNSYHQEPLVCYWLDELDKVRILPQSFFNALIVELLRRREVKLDRTRKQYRSAFVFDVTLPTCECSIILVDKGFYLEIFADEFTNCEDCRPILNIIQTCTKHVLDQIRLSSLGDLQYGLRCHSKDCGIGYSHPSTCTNRNTHVFKCLVRGNKWAERNDETLFWFKGLSIAAGRVGNDSKKPQLNEIYRLLEEKSAEWYKIGAAFDVSRNDRESIQTNVFLYPDDNRRLECVLDNWLQGTVQFNVTWNEFIRVLKELNYKDTVEKTEQFLLKL